MRRRMFLSSSSSVAPGDITVNIELLIQNNVGVVVTNFAATALMQFNEDELQLGGSDVPTTFPIGYNCSRSYTYSKKNTTENITLEGFEFVAQGVGAGKKCVATSYVDGELVGYTDNYLGPSGTNYSQTFTSQVTIKPGDTVEILITLELN